MYRGIDNTKLKAIYKITLWPMRLLMYIFGALPYESHHEQYYTKFVLIWRLIHLSLVSSFVIWISILRFLRYHEVLYKKDDIFSNGMDIISYLTLIIVHAIVYWENTWKAYKYKVIFQNFELLRNKFMCELKRAVNVGRIRLYAVLLYSLLGVYLIILMFIIFIRYIKSLNGFRLLVMQYGDTILKLKLIEFTIFASTTMALQMERNAYWLQYMNEIGNSKILEWHVKRRVYEKFYILQDIHNILILNTCYIQQYCSWSLPGLLLHMFFEFTITAYWIYFSFDYKVSVVFRSYGFCVTILNLIILFVGCSICSKCEKLDTEFLNNIHMVSYEQFDPFLNSCLKEISLQLMHKRLYFTAGGFINVNLIFFGRYLFSAVCYIVILIQFQMSI